ncbi:efflux RND transporter permease subunit [Leptospira langatensis]|uniref:Efflux RND transporter permease subunit n=1 Tax=Leptospira langatensis TaxID=2484983 RepID=A0A5F1ZNE1_9LEPT|nr:CusA/CzcA family heavy metal efflux RND transporter [Leptospira langatensis]TGK05214.1 efflux RND transporter permease subunit [Leptospira langatensis]TGL38349.1 efflux RND transporter permease subunit [Leptospira langatensis]
MIEKLISFSLHHRAPSIILAITILSFGAWSWIEIKKEAYPDVGDTQVSVIALFPGKAALEVERRVTLPLERELNSVPYVLTRRSKTIFGLSVLQLVFEEGVSDFIARQLVLERLRDVDIPDEAEVSLAPLTGPVGEIFRYTLEGTEDFTPMDLRTLQDWVVIPALRQVPGVADIINFGGLQKQYHIITDPGRLYRYGLTLSDILDAVRSNNRNTGGNILTRGDQGFVVRGLGAIQNVDDIQNIVVTAVKGTPIYISNLASVEEYPRRPDGIFEYVIRHPVTGEIRSGTSSVQGIVAMRRGENPSELIERVKARIKILNQTGLPKGVKISVTYDRTELVQYTVRTVYRTLFEGVSIVTLVLIFFLGSVRSALVVASTIPVSLLFGFSMMKLTGIPANLLSLGAIDFGIIVDGAVVMVENIFRKYSEARAQRKTKMGYAELLQITHDSSLEVGREIFFSIGIIIFAYLPIFTFQRVEGRLFSPMAFTLSFAIFGSLLLTLTVIPVLMTFIYRTKLEKYDGKPLESQNFIFLKLRDFYGNLLASRLGSARKTVTYSILAIVLILGFSYYKIGTEFLPELDEGAINIRGFFPVGMHLKSGEQYMGTVKEILLKNEQVSEVLIQLGRNDEGTDPYGPNRMEILVGLKDYELWREKIPKAELLKRIKDSLSVNLPGVHFLFSQPIIDNVTESVTGSVSDLAIFVNGEDLPLLRSYAEKILEIVKSIPGATESGIEQERDQAQLTIEIDRKRSARFGINAKDILDTIEAAIGGTDVGELYEGNKRFDILVRYTTDFRSSIERVKNLLVASPSGGRIPLSELASVELKDGPTIIQRQDGKRQISIRTNIRGRDQGGFVKEAKDKVEASLQVPEGVTIGWGGQFENLSRAGKRLQIVIPATLFFIYCFLFLIFKNGKYAILAMSGIPISMTGGILALLLRGMNFSVSAGVGFVSLFGISTMTGVLFVSRMIHLLKDKDHHDPEKSVLQAAYLQFRPRLMTVLLALLGLIPAATASGIGSDVQRPLATVIVGGLTLELFTLIYLPCLFYLSIQRKKV